MLFQITMMLRQAWRDPRLLRPVLFTRVLVNFTQDKPSFPKVLPVGLPLQNELPEVKYVPDNPPNQQNYPNMSRRLLQCRGIEQVHDKLIHKQYGIMALAPGLMKEGHFNTIREMVNKRLDLERCFAVWRVDPPWHPWYFKGLNKKRGAGKGSIDHFVTPIKANRLIIEIGGTLSFEHLYRTLLPIAEVLPFPCIPVSQHLLEQWQAECEEITEKNVNPLRWEYLLRNNIGNSHRYADFYDIEFARYGPKVR